MKRTFAVWIAAAVSACSPYDEQVRTRAAFDMQCPADQLEIVHIDRQTRGITGCGRRRTYVKQCNGSPTNLATECNWVTDSASTQAP